MSGRSSWLDRPIGVRGVAAAAAVALVVVSVAVACTAQADSTPAQTGPIRPSPQGEWHPRQLYAVEVTVGGQTIPCVVWDQGRGGGLSCDWSKGGAR